MAKDLIIGGASGYNWNQLKYWVKSIKNTGFKGDIVVVATDITKETLDKLTSEGVIVLGYGKQLEDRFVKNSKLAPHVERFIYIWEYLERNKGNYRFVTVTDTRDVIFQKDPTEFLLRKLGSSDFKSIVCAAEGLNYEHEPWGRQNMKETFGEFFYEKFKEYPICNVGTIAGFYTDIKDLILLLFQLSINRTIPIVDQAVFNFIINLEPYQDCIIVTTNDDDWAVQLACSLAAIKSGSGDIGAVGDLESYKENYQFQQPIINGTKVSNNYREYTIVHQWDRIPFLKEKIEAQYAND